MILAVLVADRPPSSKVPLGHPCSPGRRPACERSGASAETATLVVVALGVPHGFRVVTETVLEVVAEYDIGTLYPVLVDGGDVELCRGAST
jgi:hypothetical protein